MFIFVPFYLIICAHIFSSKSNGGTDEFVGSPQKTELRQFSHSSILAFEDIFQQKQHCNNFMVIRYFITCIFHSSKNNSYFIWTNKSYWNQDAFVTISTFNKIKIKMINWFPSYNTISQSFDLVRVQQFLFLTWISNKIISTFISSKKGKFAVNVQKCIFDEDHCWKILFINVTLKGFYLFL